MAEETVVQTDLTESPETVNAEESTTAETPKVGEGVDPQASQVEGEHKKSIGGWQRREQKAKAEAEYWREVALGKLKQPEEKAKPVVEEEKEPDPDDPKFANTLDYLKAVRAYDRSQIKKEIAAEQAAKEQERTQKTEQQKQADSWEQKKAVARAKYDNFDDALDADIPITEAISKVLLKSDSGADLAYYLGTHPEEAQKIAKMDAIDTAMAMGRIEATLAQKQAEPEEKQTPAVTKATPPPKPVQKATAAKAVDIYDPDLPYPDYVKAREASLKKGK